MGEFVLLTLACSFSPLILLVVFVLLTLACSFAPLILLVLLLLLLLGAFFIALSVLLTKGFFQAFAPQGAGPPATARLGQLFLVWPSW